MHRTRKSPDIVRVSAINIKQSSFPGVLRAGASNKYNRSNQC